MVIFRLAPGEVAPWAGSYRLVGHYGEWMGRTVSAKQGDRLPLVETEGKSELWFVLDDELAEAIDAA